jgi:hypothetical protein
LIGLKLALFSHASEALAAVNRPVGLGLKGNPSLTTAGSAHSSEILTGSTGSVLAGITASLAALRLVLETALSIELLLTSGEHELLAAFLAYKCLVFVHVINPLFDVVAPVGRLLIYALSLC